MDVSDLLISYRALDKSSISTPTVDNSFTQVEVIPASMLSRASKVAKTSEKEEDSKEYSSDFWGFYSKGEDEKPYNTAE
jgi:lysozyme